MALRTSRWRRATRALDGRAAASETSGLFGEEIGNDKVFLFLGRPIGEFMTFRGKLVTSVGHILFPRCSATATSSASSRT